MNFILGQRHPVRRHASFNKTLHLSTSSLFSIIKNSDYCIIFFVWIKLSLRKRGRVNTNWRAVGTNKQSIMYKLETQLRHPSKHDHAIESDSTKSVRDLLCLLRRISHFSRAHYGRCLWPYHVFWLHVLIFRMCTFLWCRPRWPRRWRHRSAGARLLGLWVRILSAAWMFLSCECCALYRYRPLRGTNPSSRGVLASVYASFSVTMCNNNTLHLQWVHTKTSD